MVEPTNLSKRHFFKKIRGEKRLKRQKNCKICSAPEWLAEAFTYRYHVEHLSYVELIEIYEPYGLHLNIYNCSVHIHRHLEQKDFIEAEQKQERWQQCKAQKAD